MICTQQQPLSPKQLYLSALQADHELYLDDAYSKRASYPPAKAASSSAYSEPWAPEYYTQPVAGPSNHRSRQAAADFRQQVEQRQARLESIRRHEFARRLAQRALNDASASEYAIKRLPPPHARPAERLNAAIKIQRVFRAHQYTTRVLRRVLSLTDDLAYAATTFLASHNAFLNAIASRRQPTVAARRSLLSALRTHSSTLHQTALEIANTLRPFHHNQQLRFPTHGTTIASALRDFEELAARERDLLERVKVDLEIAEMKGKKLIRPSLRRIEEVEEPQEVILHEFVLRDSQVMEYAPVFEDEDEEDDAEQSSEDVLVYDPAILSEESDSIPSTPPSCSSSCNSSPVSSLATLSDAEDEHYTVDAVVIPEYESDDEYESDTFTEYYTSVEQPPRSPLAFKRGELAALANKSTPFGQDEDDGDDVPNLRRTLAMSLLAASSRRSSFPSSSSSHKTVVSSSPSSHVRSRHAPLIAELTVFYDTGNPALRRASTGGMSRLGSIDESDEEF